MKVTTIEQFKDAAITGIIEAMLKQGWNAERFASVLGVSREHAVRILHRQRPISLKHIFEAAEALDIDIDFKMTPRTSWWRTWFK